MTPHSFPLATAVAKGDEAAPSPLQGSGRPLLSVRELRVSLQSGLRPVDVLRGVDLDVAPGEIVGVVGESGSGKTMTALSVLRLLPEALRVSGGTITFQGRDLLAMPGRELRELRGTGIAAIFQDPHSHLNPVFTVGDQLEAVVKAHAGRRLSSREARRRAVELLARVRIAEPERRLVSYPHQFSGGMAQRVMIAMALGGSPSLLIADEPTAALDVTVQAEILRLLREIARERGMAVLFISHNLGAVWQLCDRVCVMYAGQIVETAPTRALVDWPAHPYTRALLGALPRMAVERPTLASIPGMVPAATNLPSGCAFHPRCRHALAQCRTATPGMVEVGAGHESRCVLAGEISRSGELFA